MMNAWRIVQATLFEKIYGSAKFHRIEKAVSMDKWFEPGSLAQNHGARYHPGGYLRDMLYVIFTIIAVCVTVMAH